MENNKRDIPMIRRHFIRIAKWFIFVFFAMFVFRMIYGYINPQRAYSGNNSVGGSYFNENDTNLRKNYATEKISAKQTTADNLSFNSLQKYEKTANLTAQTSQYEEDENQIRQVIKEYNAIIQYEQKTGLKGRRELHLMIGVVPKSFDDFYKAIEKIAPLKSSNITKVDKTNEYRELNAKKTSLMKTLESLNDLKSKNGQVADFVTLHDKILEIEDNLQKLGVQLGNFDAENEFCTVRFSLYEGFKKEKNIHILDRIKIALEWTIKYYAVFVFSMMVMSVLSLAILTIMHKLGVVKAIEDKLKD